MGPPPAVRGRAAARLNGAEVYQVRRRVVARPPAVVRSRLRPRQPAERSAKRSGAHRQSDLGQLGRGLRDRREQLRPGRRDRPPGPRGRGRARRLLGLTQRLGAGPSPRRLATSFRAIGGGRPGLRAIAGRRPGLRAIGCASALTALVASPLGPPPREGTEDLGWLLVGHRRRMIAHGRWRGGAT